MRNMTAKLLSCAVVALAAGSVPALAADASPSDFRAAPQTVPDILSAKQKQLYTQVLAAIRGQRWADMARTNAWWSEVAGVPLHTTLAALNATYNHALGLIAEVI